MLLLDSAFIKFLIGEFINRILIRSSNVRATSRLIRMFIIRLRLGFFGCDRMSEN